MSLSFELHPRMKKYVEDGEDEKVGEWLDGGIREVKEERQQEGINGTQGEKNLYRRGPVSAHQPREFPQ